jgi:hypothetical protein
VLDVLLSDTPLWLLHRYDTLLLPTPPSHDAAYVTQRVLAFLDGGGAVVMTSAVLAELSLHSASGSLGGCSATVAASATVCPTLSAGTEVFVAGLGPLEETGAFTACELSCDGAWSVDTLAWATVQSKTGAANVRMFLLCCCCCC